MRFVSFQIPPASAYRSMAGVSKSKSPALWRYREFTMVLPLYVLSTSVHAAWFMGNDLRDSGTALYCIHIRWCNRTIVWAVARNQLNTG